MVTAAGRTSSSTARSPPPCRVRTMPGTVGWWVSRSQSGAEDDYPAEGPSVCPRHRRRDAGPVCDRVRAWVQWIDALERVSSPAAPVAAVCHGPTSTLRLHKIAVMLRPTASSARSMPRTPRPRRDRGAAPTLSRDLGDPARNPVRGRLHGVVGQVRIARGRRHPVVAKELADHRKSFTDQQTATGEAVPEVMDS